MLAALAVALALAAPIPVPRPADPAAAEQAGPAEAAPPETVAAPAPRGAHAPGLAAGAATAAAQGAGSPLQAEPNFAAGQTSSKTDDAAPDGLTARPPLPPRRPGGGATQADGAMTEASADRTPVTAGSAPRPETRAAGAAPGAVGRLPDGGDDAPAAEDGRDAKQSAVAAAAGAPVPLPPRRPGAAEEALREATAAPGEARTAAVASADGAARGRTMTAAAWGDPVPLPPARPGAAEELQRADAAAAVAPAADQPATAEAAGAAPGPRARPDGDAPVVRALFAPPQGNAAPPRGTAPRGMVCRDPRLVGAPAASFVGGVPGCGIVDPVRVTSIDGVRMSTPITVDCRTARVFADWISGVAQPAARELLGGRIDSVWTMGSYTCRPRNNRPGARLSEHSAGRAVDVGGVTLADGRRIVVEEDWRKGQAGTFLRTVWKGACGGFTTVIGPEGDRRHRDHLHFDTAHRKSTWCR